ncbi:MAG: response regulator [Bacteroidota bacterium]
MKKKDSTRFQSGQEFNSEKMNPRLLTAALHQFKLPLNVIIGFADLLKDRKLDTETRDTYANLIYKDSNTLLQLVDNLIDLFKIEAQQAPIEKTACYINKVFNEIFKEFEMVPGLQRSGHLESLCIQTDGNKLKQVLSNIVAHSFQLSGQHKVEIGYIMKEKFLEFYIRDNTKSLSVEDLDTFFSSLEENSTISDHARFAAALRLAISQKLVNSLGGKLWTEKKRGEETAIHFTVPFELAKTVTPAPPRTEMDHVPIWNDFHVMIAEDIDTNYIYLAQLLKPTGIQITWARNGREAVDIAARTKDLDLILMDILMPEMDGYEAAKRIKEENSRMPIIVQTAYTLENEPEEILSLFDDFLTKPIWSKDLLRVVSKFIGSQN